MDTASARERRGPNRIVLVPVRDQQPVRFRADNILLTDHGAIVVDWPWACQSAASTDLVLFAPSVTMQGGPPPVDLFASSRTGRAADPPAVAALVCALAGYLTERSLQPPPPGLPTVRAFQATQATIARQWLASPL